MGAGEEELQSVETLFIFLSWFINRSTQYGKTAPIKFVHTHHSRTFADMTVDMKHRSCGAEEQHRLFSVVEEFKRLFVEMSDGHCYSDLYISKPRFFDVLLEYIRIFSGVLLFESGQL